MGRIFKVSHTDLEINNSRRS